MKKGKQPTEPAVLQAFARLLGTKLRNGRMKIPEPYGQGYCRGYVFNEHIRMLILNYELKEEVILHNPEVHMVGKMILFKFQHIFQMEEDRPPAFPSVLIATSTLDTDAVIPIQSSTSSINIEVDAGYLNSIFESSNKSPALQSLLQNTQPLLFEQLIHPALQKVVDEMMTEQVDEVFELFFLRIKAEELVCRLLMELEKRDEEHLYALNSKDIQAIYKIRERMLAHIDVPPVIDELALAANMSPTKLKRLFRQIFGNSIFSYYQEFRMKEAARLLKEEHLSVSDVGYQLGFSNLSHFAKVFKEHMGVNPKKYAMG
ncbi:AraC-like DNA-binding protein [Chitinophaga terrae (ex Kim and Jung 2007)]|uniref:helix-turn-helix transcriptional regulator n=1 Tax=Chitinophaga terrae (ex Kim and Jung 2007) TaxID=408074 RepID=UPI00278268D0|nr:AraC family transcriptional regulator [Chitinophaga terrae (ex Kim and Jung 2007)]MDQ0109825.1 AraC-like DNA-binding protein [Chitinophaga terrae (ex Kim and Jung 2007)]